ncbi:hypothetical protein [Okeania sp. SIO3B5]|nr:hypothetical protein [Okeania sp. SIO3B5]
MNSDRLFFDRGKAQNMEYSKEIPENLRNFWGKLQPNNWTK